MLMHHSSGLEDRSDAVRRARWGREHLADLEQSEQIYLVIRDQVLYRAFSTPFLFSCIVPAP